MDNQEKIQDEATFNSDLIEILMSLFDRPFKDMLMYSIETRNAEGLKQLVEILKECQY